MPTNTWRTTPANEIFEAESDDVGLGLDTTDPSDIYPSATDHLPAGTVWIYSHGYSSRNRITQGGAALLDALNDYGLGMDSQDWCRLLHRNGNWRATLRGSVSLGSRKPGSKSNTTTAMARLDRRHRMKIYSLGVEVREAGDEGFLDVAGVNKDDARRLIEDVLGLTVTVEHFRVLERYIVLTPVEAQKLCLALGGTTRRGRGSDAAKLYKLKNHAVHITLGRCSRRKMLLKLYRIGPGATAAYRLEASLTGKTRDRRHFSVEAAAKLDQVLLDLVREHGLSPIAKPARWEPVLRTAVDDVPRDALLRRVRPSGWRGRGVLQEMRAIMAECNTPPEADSTVSPEETASDHGTTRIRYCTGNEALSSTTNEPGKTDERVGMMRVTPHRDHTKRRIAITGFGRC